MHHNCAWCQWDFGQERNPSTNVTFELYVNVWFKKHTSYSADDAVSCDLSPSERPDLVLSDVTSQSGLPRHNANGRTPPVAMTIADDHDRIRRYG